MNTNADISTVKVYDQSLLNQECVVEEYYH